MIEMFIEADTIRELERVQRDLGGADKISLEEVIMFLALNFNRKPAVKAHPLYDGGHEL